MLRRTSLEEAIIKDHHMKSQSLALPRTTTMEQSSSAPRPASAVSQTARPNGQSQSGQSGESGQIDPKAKVISLFPLHLHNRAESL